MPKTRHASGTGIGSILGHGEAMLTTELPTLRAVLRHGLYLQEKELVLEDRDRRNYPVALMSEELALELVSIWQRANAMFKPPVIFTSKSILRKIQVRIIWSRTFQNKALIGGLGNS